jgi:hypothetical protein
MLSYSRKLRKLRKLRQIRLSWVVLAVRCTEFHQDGYDPRDDMLYSCLWYGLRADGRDVVFDTEARGRIDLDPESLASRIRKYLPTLLH